MKTAYVLVAHVGDRGRKDEGDIIPDLTTQRFEDLEKVGIVRAATAAEIKEWKPRFEAEADENPVRTIVVDVADLQSLRETVTKHTDTIVVLTDERDTARARVVEFVDLLKGANVEIERLKAELGEAVGFNKQHEETIVALTEERDQARAAVPVETSTSPAGGEKEAVAPENKQAPTPDNKQAPAPKTKA
jgi:hypothetical protein